MPVPKKSIAGNIAKKVIKKVIKGNTPAKANARGLKAAQGKSLAPKGYKPDTAGRAVVKKYSEPGYHGKNASHMASGEVDYFRKVGKLDAAPKNKGK